MVVERTVPSDPRIVLVTPFAQIRKAMDYKTIENASKYVPSNLHKEKNKSPRTSKSVQTKE